MNNATDNSKATPFLERHKFTCMFLAFCLGLLVCLAASTTTEKAAHGKTLSPASADVLDIAPEPTDSMILEHSSNGNAAYHRHRVGPQSATGIPSSAGGVVGIHGSRDSLTSLRVRLQI